MAARTRNLLALLVAAFAAMLCGCRGEEPYSNPAADFDDKELVGTWEAHYRIDGHDKLIINEDGTFKENYWEEGSDYVFETPWNPWHTERFPDGRIRLHLQGARKYDDGIHWAERMDPSAGRREGTPDPWLPTPDAVNYWDPIARDLVPMQAELILELQLTRSGKLVLLQMKMSQDSAFTFIFEGVAVGFRRADTNQP